jgi:hypothetical protein
MLGLLYSYETTPAEPRAHLEMIICTKTRIRTPDPTAHGLVTVPYTPPWPRLLVGVESRMGN